MVENYATISIKLQEYSLSYFYIMSFLPILLLISNILISNIFFITNLIFNIYFTISIFTQKYLKIILEFRQYSFKFYINSENIFYSYSEYIFDLKFIKILTGMVRTLPITIQKLSSLQSAVPVLNQFDELFTFTFIVKYVIALVLLALILLLLPSLLAEEVLDIEKNSAYECGFEPFFINSIGIEVHFLIVAFIFLIFDMELLFLTMKIVNSSCLGDLGLSILALYTLTIFLMLVIEFVNGALS